MSTNPGTAPSGTPAAGTPADATAGTPAPGNPAAGATPDTGTQAPGTPAAGTGTPAPGTPAPDAAAQPDWRAGIEDEALRNVANRFNAPVDAIKTIVDMRTQLSDPTRIKVPGENASEEDKAKYRKALGIPDKVEDYSIELPEGIEMTEADKVVLDAVLPHALEAGIPKGAMNQFVGKFLELGRQFQEQAVAEVKRFGEASEAQLKKEWGADFDTNLTIANRAAETFGGADFKKFLNETQLATGGLLGDHPLMARFLATQGRKMSEGDLILGGTPEQRQSIQEQIDDLNKQVPVGSAGYTSKEHQAKLQALYAKLHGNTPIVGGTARVA